MKLKDKEGRTIVRGSVFQSSVHKDQSKQAYCIGVTDHYVILAHDQKKVLPWVLWADDMHDSRWVVCGWRDLEKDPLGKLGK